MKAHSPRSNESEAQRMVSRLARAQVQAQRAQVQTLEHEEAMLLAKEVEQTRALKVKVAEAHAEREQARQLEHEEALLLAKEVEKKAKAAEKKAKEVAAAKKKADTAAKKKAHADVR